MAPPPQRVNDTIAWTPGPRHEIAPSLPAPKRQKRVAPENVIHQEPTPVTSAHHQAIEDEEEEAAKEPMSTPTLLDISLNRKIAEASARFVKLRQEKEKSAPKSVLRKAFEQIVAENGAQPSEEPLVAPSKRGRGSAAVPPGQPTLRNFLGTTDQP